MDKDFNVTFESKMNDFKSKDEQKKEIHSSNNDDISKAALISYLLS